MITFKNIVVPIDFSAASKDAARFAQSLAQSFGSRLTLLHVLAPLEFEFAFIPPQDDRLQGLLHERTARTQAELNRFLSSELGDGEVDRVLAEGLASAEILACARTRGADMIVMPTHGYGPVRRFLIGSVTAKVLDEACLPVWTGVHFPKKEQGPIQLKSILCALDLKPGSERILAFASNLAVKSSANLTVVHAMPERGEDAGDYSDSNFRVASANRVQVRIEEIQRAVGTEAEMIVESGPIQGVVAEVAQRHHADTIVIGRSHPNDIMGRLRTHAYAIIRHAPCPVVSV